MPRYSLIVARNGNLMHKTAEWPNELVAECWAVGEVALRFDLDPEEFDTIEKIAPETDGIEFVEVEADSIATAGLELVQLLERDFGKPNRLFDRNAASLDLLEATARLAASLVRGGYQLSN